MSVLIVFGKYFCFEKFQNFQKLCNPVLATYLTSQASREPLVASLHRRFSRLSGRLKSQSRKRPRKFFKNLGFLISCDLVWQFVREWKLQLRGLLRNFHGSLLDFLTGGPSSDEKHLYNFFKILSQGFWRLIRDSYQSQKSGVLRFKDSF